MSILYVLEKDDLLASLAQFPKANAYMRQVLLPRPGGAACLGAPV